MIIEKAKLLLYKLLWRCNSIINLKDKTVIRFLAVGILNTIVGYGVFALLISFNIHYSLASLISQVVGTIHSFFWNKFFTFKTKEYSISEVLRFFSVYAASYLINLLILFIFIDIFGSNKFIAGLITLLITTIISFWGHKYFSFKSSNRWYLL